MTIPRKARSSDLWFFIFAIAGSMITLGIAMLSGAFSVISLLMGNPELTSQTATWFVIFIFLSLAGVPAVLFGFRSLRGMRDARRPISRAAALIPVTVFPIALGLGFIGFNAGLFPNILGPAAQILGACGSSTFAILLVRKHSPALSKRRLWGQFTVGLWAVPFFAFFSEIILLIPVLLLFVLGASGSIEGRALLDLLANLSSSEITEVTELLMAMPWVLALIFGFVSLLVPLLEEALKTMVIWPLLRRGLSPAEAFLSGVIGGASYGLIEGILLSQQTDAWLAVMVARAGATLMHAFTTGIATWGLAEGIVRKRWSRLGLGYFLAVAFHGLWNAIAISLAILEGAKVEDSVTQAYRLLENALPIAIVGMVIIAIFALPRIAKRLSPRVLEVQDRGVASSALD
ncbi:MAG: PrsW family intramembrane metalloprotease [Chloroflexi bacterium]|nr:PrsW family intramembrane metalloprotease [Chloroflexota bacterium]